MSKVIRFAFAFLGAIGFLAAPLRAYTVEEMKAMEAKVKAVVQKNQGAVVSLMGERTSGAGSGTVISADGLILTAAHVTQGNENMVVIFPGGKQVRCKVLGANYQRDVSLAKIEQPGTYQFAEMGDSDKLDVTTIVLAMGHPGGYDLRRTPPLRIGRISSKNLGGYLVSDATLIGGDSGGPLFDLDGKVVGIHSSISTSLSFNRCAPVNAAKADWEKLLAGERWGRMAGFADRNRGRELDRAVIGGALDPESKNGAAVVEVYEKSPIQAAGIKAGDIIVKAGGTSVKTSEELINRLAKAKPGEKIEVVYLRDGAEQKAEVALISRAEMNQRLGIEEPRRRNRRP